MDTDWTVGGANVSEEITIDKLADGALVIKQNLCVPNVRRILGEHDAVVVVIVVGGDIQIGSVGNDGMDLFVSGSRRC